MRDLLRSVSVLTGMLAVAGCTMLTGRMDYVLRVNCGSDQNYVDKEGNTWLADADKAPGAEWSSPGGQDALRPKREVEGTDCPDVYLTERYSMSFYNFVVPNGKYTVTLHMAETYGEITAPGQRVFSVSVNGEEVLTDLDLFKETGGRFVPFVKACENVVVDEGEIVIGFTPGTQNPAINAIQIRGH